MYTIIVFALALLSPMPFISPFDYGVQDATAQSPFGPFGSDQNLPTDAIAQNTSTIDIVTSVTDLSASITSPVVSGISTSSEIFGIASATINNTPYAIVSYIFGDIVYIINMTTDFALSKIACRISIGSIRIVDKRACNGCVQVTALGDCVIIRSISRTAIRCCCIWNFIYVAQLKAI